MSDQDQNPSVDKAESQNNPFISNGSNSKMPPREEVKQMGKIESIPEEDLRRTMEILREHQYLCESENRFVEAEAAKNMFNEFLQQMELRSNESLKSVHLQQMIDFEQTHFDELTEFTL